MGRAEGASKDGGGARKGATRAAPVAICNGLAEMRMGRAIRKKAARRA
jgi:hypothetical protein